jgi:uncharacterized protein YcfL
MKKLLLLALTFLVLFSCKKRKEIVYPATMVFGENVLAIDNIIENKAYSFGAKLGKKANLKVVLTNISGASVQPKPIWYYSDASGWNISNYNSDTQTFTSNKNGEIDLQLSFSGSPGACKIDYYENSTTVTKTKYLNW